MVQAFGLTCWIRKEIESAEVVPGHQQLARMRTVSGVDVRSVIIFWPDAKDVEAKY